VWSIVELIVETGSLTFGSGTAVEIHVTKPTARHSQRNRLISIN
jgi:hypothetical protein